MPSPYLWITSPFPDIVERLSPGNRYIKWKLTLMVGCIVLSLAQSRNINFGNYLKLSFQNFGYFVVGSDHSGSSR